ncbi:MULTISPECIES: MBL fold metallo-hydrolase [Pontibacillus]|uniref:Rhodanese-like domain-containing protein n=1 Tax=Pontibacillus chungwhensis TaxID=265426 RepID=A0ABY8V1N0_9BACI|nr:MULTISPECIES: MBL fold metallo-hydrolase [Pontibacillus]MCD5325545.1 MBL fold metallo-hydrolase [Pontibacillus sp. HN14]WIF98654.1 rhodanese-like domain-containing protein [Pontibacillus chungwhensis]
MLLKYFYDEKLAQASYMVGCQATGEALVVDPSRDIQAYLDTAKKENLTITRVTETHIHADFVSGAKELATETGATAMLSGEGGNDWTYQFLDEINHEIVRDGDQFMVGNVKIEVMHTPGHTPESISFVLYDRDQDTPMGVFTGDFVFVGDVGRPDLLEKAAGQKDTSRVGAKQMFESLKRFKQLPDHMQVWPGHGAGSACGKALGAIPSSTVGYEKATNWAVRHDEEEAFINELISEQPEPPKYFAVMKKVNKVGPALIRELGEPKNTVLTADELSNELENGMQLIDTRPASEFAKEHIAGTINIPHNKSFANWAGWLVDYNKPVYLIADERNIEDLTKSLRSIGADDVAGYMETAAIAGLKAEGIKTESYEIATPDQLKDKIANGEVNLIDVRNEGEWNAGHIPQAKHIMLGYLQERIDEVPTDKPVVLQCQSGGRSAMATSILQANGIKNVTNMAGGFGAWSKEDLPQTK